VSAASAVNARGGFWFVTYKGGLSAELFIEMLRMLMRSRRRPLFLILDSLPAHKAKIVQDMWHRQMESSNFTSSRDRHPS